MALGLFGWNAAAQTVCLCDPARPETMKVRQCSLCSEAEKQTGESGVFFLKDINPTKPTRWLALPRKHGENQHHLHELTAPERAELWTAAIEKAKSLFGDDAWGVAYNGAKVRTQCHAHIHIGRLIRNIDTGSHIVARSPAQIPAPPFEGVWVHPAGGKLHVHLGEQITETVLLR